MAPFQMLGRMTLAQVNIPVAVLIWLMIVPMLLKVDFGALHRVAEQWRGIAVTVGINWLVKPFSMALLGWLFIGLIFRPWLPAGEIDSYIAGLILLSAAPCTAMVFVWSNLTDGEPNFTLSQVALNDTIMVFAFAPIVGLLLGLSSITVPWTTLFLSVVLYIVVPVIAARLWRRPLLAHGGDAALAQTGRRLQPISLVALLAMLNRSLIRIKVNPTLPHAAALTSSNANGRTGHSAGATDPCRNRCRSACGPRCGCGRVTACRYRRLCRTGDRIRRE